VETNQEHRIELAEDPVTSLNLVAQAAESWGGIWQPESRHNGRLGLPVVAGLRYGWVAGELSAKPSGSGSRLIYRVDKSDYQLQKSTASFLLLAGLGAAVTVVAPFMPSLLSLVPLGIILSVGAWFLVIARLRNSGPEEFFEELRQETEGDCGQTE